MKRILCKLCLAKNPNTPGFMSEPFETMEPEEIVKKLDKLDKHIAAEHPQLAMESVEVGASMAQFLRLCAFEFEEPFAVASRDKLRYDLAKLTRAYRLSDEKIKEKVCINSYTDAGGVLRMSSEDVISLIQSLRDQLEEIGEYSQDAPSEPSVLIAP